MKMLTKVVVATATGVLSVGLATAGAFAATGSLSVTDAPGQVLKLDGVGPAANHANQQALSHASKHAKGLFGTSTAVPTPTEAPSVTAPTSGEATADTSTTVKATTPSNGVVPRTAAQDASTVKGSQTGSEISTWAKSNGGAQVVAPPAAVDIQGRADVKLGR
ncbi:hypothetical protein [Rathayibacter soli]|uniref:hypothetical protein n=1 Tax=Rathayibacter soli TaxID=3144168 RepID=UPI0027E4A4BE|nr:hypothetical protein [Glaciibacter superstes]